MAKLHRKRVMKVKVEVTKGTKIAGDEGLYVEDLDIKPSAEFTQRRGTGKYIGNQYPGTLGGKTGTCSFRVEIRGNGASAIDAGILILLQAGGLKDSTGYKPVSSVADQKTISIDVWEDGKKKGLAGAMGTLQIEADTGGKAYLVCEFMGIWQTPVDEALPAFAPSTEPPMYFKGGTFTVGGAAKKISKFSLDLGNQVVPEPDPNATEGLSSYIITDQDITLGFDPEAEAVADYDINGIWAAETEFAVVIVLTDGTVDITISLPKVQYTEIPEGEREGLTIYEATGQCNNDSGDDAVSISAAAA